MKESQAALAVAAAVSAAVAVDLTVEDAVVLQNANRIVLRLLPCDVVVRVGRLTPESYASAAFEIDLAVRLAETGSPVAVVEPRVEPRVYVSDGFAMSMWSYYEPVPSEEVAPNDYAEALMRLHAGMREIELASPHFTDRVAEAQSVVTDRDRSPDLPETDRELLSRTLHHLGTTVSGDSRREQLLHGEPHPGNVLSSRTGPRFADLETCCRGPIEFDLAHAPEEVGQHYQGADAHLIDQCRVLKLAMITTWRWERDDQYPNGRHRGLEGLSQIRAALDGITLDLPD